MRMSYKEVLTRNMSIDHPETAEKMLSIAWDYHSVDWHQVPLSRKKEVYRAFCYEAQDASEYFYDRTTRDDFGTLFGGIKAFDGCNDLDQEVINCFAGNIIKRFMRNADSMLEMIFEEQKPSTKELQEAAKEEMEFQRSANG